MTDRSVRICIVGGGPAGVMLGYLLARSGINATVLEKHADFLRDFRGDTVHPTTLELLWELGLLDSFLQVPHQKIHRVGVNVGGETFHLADFEHLRTHCRFAALMPQWDFLNFLSEQGKRYPAFDLRLQHEAVELLQDGNRVQGVVVKTPDGSEQIGADLVVACDGRHSILRRTAKLEVEELGVPMDVLWFRLKHTLNTNEQVLGYVNYGRSLVLIDRQTYFQTAFIIPKDSFKQVQAQGLEEFRTSLVRLAPFLEQSVAELQDWDQIKLLSVQINRLKTWSKPGLLCIGDAAHAMSPVFGVGINLAIQDAVAAAGILTEAWRAGRSLDSVLPRVQQRRELRTRLIQRVQLIAHKAFTYLFRQTGPLRVSPLVKAVLRTHLFEPVVLRIVGMGIYPERISPALLPAARAHQTTARRIGALTGVTVALICLAFTSRRRRA